MKILLIYCCFRFPNSVRKLIGYFDSLQILFDKLFSDRDLVSLMWNLRSHQYDFSTTYNMVIFTHRVLLLYHTLYRFSLIETFLFIH